MNKVIRIGVLILFLFAMAFVASFNRGQNEPVITKPSMKNLTIGSQQFQVEVARTVFEREKGLSGRESLPENEGMLFLFENAGRHGFWMIDTNFSLDFIWIKDGKVTEITENVPTQIGVPERELKVYTPAETVDAMLEVNAGFAAKKGIRVGDSVNLTNE